MNKKICLLLITLATLLCTYTLDAQEKIIRGIVTTFDSIPLVDAEVQNRSTKETVRTDSVGKFSIVSKPGDKLKVKAGGFFNEKVKLKEKTRYAAINMTLKPGEKNREYATGYTKVSDQDKLNALANLDRNDIDFSQYSDIYELIKGRFAGVQVRNREIIIRGLNSIQGSSAALIVVDGVTMNSQALDQIPPVQVKSINIIKDGGAAIYGSRGANGVIIIETRRGSD